MKKNGCFATSIALAVLLAAPAGAAPFISSFHRIHTVSSTVPHNGDVNPYGVAVVPRSVGLLHAGDILVSNFNNSQNLQGTGTTIVQIPPHGRFSTFVEFDARSLPGPCPGGVGLTTALVVLSSGWVIVGSLPTSDGTSATMQAGCLLIVNSNGRVVQTLSGGEAEVAQQLRRPLQHDRDRPFDGAGERGRQPVWSCRRTGQQGASCEGRRPGQQLQRQ